MEALSALAWLVDAGVDQLVDEKPRDWFAAAVATATAMAAPAAAATATASSSDFQQALAGIDDPALLDALVADHPASPFRGAATPPLRHGVTRAQIAIVGDWPTREDAQEAALFSGTAGRLLDAMLGAIGLNRDALLSTSVLPIASAQRGRPAPALIDAGLAVLRRRLALGGAQKLLILGDASQLLFGLPPLAGRGQWRTLALDDRRGVPALVTLAPGFLLSQPAQKARAWEDLQLFIKGPLS